MSTPMSDEELARLLEEMEKERQVDPAHEADWLGYIILAFIVGVVGISAYTIGSL